MFKVLVSDPIAKEGLERLREAGANIDLQVDVKTGLPKDELLKIVAAYDGLIVRSETKVTAEVIRAATNLKVVARAGVGVDNVDVPAATERGIIVVNTPTGNTIAACEQAFTLLLATARKLGQANISMKAGRWDRKQFMGVELAGKTLGIIGLGRIGTELAKRAAAFGMTPVAYDPFVQPAYAEKQGIILTSLDEVYRRADFISVHSPLLPETFHMIGTAAFEKMKPGVRIINAARGGIIDEDALYEALKSGKVAAAGLDVFEKEPVDPESPLVKLENVVAAPHLGASTEEAQVKVAIDAAESVVAALNGELVPNAVNLPGLSSEALAELKPYLNLATKLGRLATSLSDGPISNVEIWTLGNVLPDHARLISMAAQQGLLENQPGLDGPVNLVNARSMAARNGLEVVEKTTTESGPFTGLTISLRVQTGGSASNGDQALQPLGLRVFDGTVINGQPRIVSLNGLMVDVEPSGYMLVSRHIDRPGMIGRVGTALGSYGINIARMEVGRRERAGEAVMILAIDEPVNQAIMEELSKIDGVENLRFVSLGD
ncbi:MAG: phosphoglycerate dehydrogenase [Chloroflexi bacterium]|nr:phosphoglycerate dehydrogenase [Chloroflexota bacterium]OJV97778.1 MAG: phosphoglycerate dehydrogenase [Chloroflexi bacterium 54-19]